MMMMKIGMMMMIIVKKKKIKMAKFKVYVKKNNSLLLKIKMG
jgi:hypothetical protein